MSDINFYHLTARPLEWALPKLLERTLESGNRAVIIVSGVVDVMISRPLEAGPGIKIAPLKAGSCFGEITLIDECFRSADDPARCHVYLSHSHVAGLPERVTYVFANDARPLTPALAHDAAALVPAFHAIDAASAARDTAARTAESAAAAATHAARLRFRAVFLTTATTIMGLLPLLTEQSLQAQILIPLVTSIVFGLLAATVLILFLMPALYTIFDDFGWTAKVVPD